MRELAIARPVKTCPVMAELAPAKHELGPLTQAFSDTFTNKQEDKIALFFQDHTLYYDSTAGNYKNKTKREHLLFEFALSHFNLLSEAEIFWLGKLLTFLS